MPSAGWTELRRRRPRWPGRGVALATLALVSGGCGRGALDPAGRQADRIAQLTWLMFALGTAVFVLVLVLLAVALTRRRSADTEATEQERELVDGSGQERAQPSASSRDEGAGSRWGSPRLIVAGGIAMPAVVLTALVGATVWVGADLMEEPDDPIEIEITGHQYWWDVRYPDHEVRTANEVHLPVGQPALLTLTSEDVIHSFWVPRLAGKMDLVPGKTNHLTVEVDEVGRLDGACAEFCGLQHANMRLEVVAHEPEDFVAWLEAQAEPARPVSGDLREGQEAFLGSSCVYCHAVEGTNASSEVGPDLTHLASRDHLAAGVLPNTRGNLAAWLLDPQGIKPGSKMPATRLEPDQVNAILDYLESLE